MLRSLPFLSLLLLACHGDPGCTQENCELMYSGCGAMFDAHPTWKCWNVDPSSKLVDFPAECVKACNATPGGGSWAECIAAKAATCRASDEPTKDRLIAQCNQENNRSMDPDCRSRCAAAADTCDDACTGGGPCDACRRGGRLAPTDCRDVCPATTYERCFSCVEQCASTFQRCTEGCRRRTSY